MKKNLKTIIKNCPVLFYSHFTYDEVELAGTVSINRFEEDLKYFISSGYKFYSINQLHDIINNDETIEEKSLCLAFIDGFESEYNLAFEIIRRYGIHVDIFINPDLVGTKSDTGLSRFNWQQAQKMCESGLVNIQGFYNDLSTVDYKDVVGEIIRNIKTELGDENGNSFLNSIGNTISIDEINEMKHYGLKSQIIFYKQLCMDAINNICFGHMSMENTMSVQDFEKTINEYKSILSETKYSSKNTSLVCDLLRIKDSIYLNVIDKPLIVNRPSIAFPMSVLGVKDYDHYADFFAMEFISIMAIEKINYLGFDHFDYKTWPMLDTYRIGPDILQSINANPLLFVYEALKTGYCVDVCSDAYYIPSKLYYNTEHISHNVLIYGYDANNKMFKALSHINTGRYTHLDIDPKDLLDSFSTMYFEHLTLLKKNNWNRKYYSKHTIKRLLYEYQKSTELLFYSKPYIDFSDSKCSGVKANKWLLNEIINGEYINYPNLQSYIEHKQCMAWRIEYVANISNINILSYLSLLSQMKNCDILLPMAIKYNISSALSVKNRIVNKIYEINESENTLISYILNQL